MNSNYDAITFISKHPYFKRFQVANFVDIIKIATIFVKTILKNETNLKELGIMY